MPAPLPLKRLASDNVDSTPAKKKKVRMSGAEAVEDVADALHEIRQSMTEPVNIESNRGP